MLFQRVNRSSPEKVFVVAFNSYSTAAITNGQYVEWDWNVDGDGVAGRHSHAWPARDAGTGCVDRVNRSEAGLMSDSFTLGLGYEQVTCCNKACVQPFR